MKKFIRFFLCPGVLILIAGMSFAQNGISFNLSSPYEMQDIAGQRMGGVTVAVSDRVVNTFSNPANLTQSDRPCLFLSLSQVQTKLDFNQPWLNDSQEQDWKQGISPGYITATLPVHFLKKRLLLSASYNGYQWPEYDDRYVSKSKELFLSNSDRHGRIGSASMAIGIPLDTKFSLGIGATKWFGKVEWSFNDFSIEPYYQAKTEGSCDYTGFGWHFGARGQIGSLSLGTTVYLPMTLMKGESHANHFFDERDYQYEQKFNGALQVGAAYPLFSHLTLGLGCGFQRHAEMDYHDYKNEFSSISKLSGGIEYNLSRRNMNIPIYFGYKAYWRSKVDKRVSYGDVYTQKSEEDLFYNDVVFGASVLFHSLGFHLDSKWSASSFHLMDSLGVPPWS